jgi:N-succinyldiaminopimelate aminotransferase
MLNLAPFHIEEALETGRFSARFNALESGAAPLTLGELLSHVGVDHQLATRELLGLSLADSPNHGRFDLRQHIARLHPGAKAENVLVTTGTSEALLLVLLCLQPRRIAMILPGFQLLSELGHGVGAEILPLAMRWDPQGRPQADVEQWSNVIRQQKPDMVLVNHPHNPSGLVLSEEQLQHVARAAEACGACIVGDEHYRFLTPQPPLGPTLWQPPLREQAKGPLRLVTGSFIKCLGTPGLRIGWCVAPEPVIKRMQNLKNYTTHTVNPVSEWLAERVLRRDDLFAFAAQRAVWTANRSSLQDWLRGAGQQTGWVGIAPEGGWVTCVSHRSLPHGRKSLDHALQAAGCGLLDLRLFEWSRYGHKDCWLTEHGGFRMGLGMTTDSFNIFLDALSSVGKTLG